MPLIFPCPANVTVYTKSNTCASLIAKAYREKRGQTVTCPAPLLHILRVITGLPIMTYYLQPSVI